jgi:1-acyl-sn-glycerol-3-phosphate acyltransferase
MQTISHRLRAPSLIQAAPRGWDEAPPGGGLVRRIRAVRRGLVAFLFTVVAAAVQAVCLVLPGRARVGFARFYWAAMCRLIGLRVRVVGTPANKAGVDGLAGRPVVFASNHSSWLDVLVLGGAVEACFISKAEVGTWPIVKTVARLGRTVFVSRQARAVGRERDEMRARLDGGDNLILFPEGTSNDGSRVLPFRSTFFSIVDSSDTAKPLIQPVSVVYDQLGGLPIGRASRAVFAWYGDMDLGSHFWRLAQQKGLRATVLLHTPVDPADYASRKELSNAVWETVAAGAATLRQNRPAVPRPAAAPGGVPLVAVPGAGSNSGGVPAFA